MTEEMLCDGSCHKCINSKDLETVLLYYNTQYNCTSTEKAEQATFCVCHSSQLIGTALLQY